MTLRFLVLALAFSLTACGGDDVSTDEVQETGAPSTAFGRAAQGMGALKDMADQMEESANTAPAEPVNHRVLAEVLPEEAAGFPQASTEGESQSMGGAFSISQRSAVYETEGEDGQITVEVMDLGGLPSVAMFGAPWAMMDVDKETDTTYERTITYQGQRGYRKYDTERRRGELSALIENRYLVKVSGRDVEDAQMEEALQAVDTRRLASMKDEGRPAS
ncbi:hypothetical protein [Rubricoccus marinus]|uniref:DUF4367 domain-containing protein n=1 Tax=Rubricoccus marinus TaxID=716817 RepID=A0A259TWG2_9BACT|nr:hypothetical protein [Rubricoccus marinus]OZC02109.1 hypothetical protein BSZ36_03385 [Rubricoccus marinus]